jgi:hypothetical protein
MVALVQDFFRAGAAVGDTLRLRRSGSVPEDLATPSEVDSASAEVERARDATNSAIALSRAPTGGNT